MSEVKVNKISPRTNCGTVTLGDSGDSFVIPSGATITNNGTQTGFGRTGAVDWVTTVQTSTITAATGKGYFVNTTGGAITANLPAGAAGSIVAFKDYANTFDDNNLTISANGSEKIDGDTLDLTVSTEGEALTLVYIDSTKGWLVVSDGNRDAGSQALYIAATGGNTTITCGDNKIHVFTGPGTLCVSCVGNPQGSDKAEYLVVAGGGGGGGAASAGSGGRGGGGGGGWRSFTALPSSGLTPPNGGPGSTINAPVGIAVTPGGMPITVGAGGAAGPAPSTYGHGSRGVPSVFGPITSTGGGGGGGYPNPAPSPTNPEGPGGSGGGAYFSDAQGAGNTPPVSPPQGNSGTQAPPGAGGAGTGGGGAGASPYPSAVQSPIHTGTNGGAGSNVPDSFFGPTAPSYGQSPSPLGPNGRYFAGGGGGGSYCNGSPGAGGAGGGGAGNKAGTGNAGSCNTGGGGGGTGNGPYAGGTGGSGIVVIRYKFQN